MRVVDKIQRKLHAYRFVRSVLNSPSQQIEESRNLAGKYGRNSDIPVKLE